VLMKICIKHDKSASGFDTVDKDDQPARDFD
jgi:hypothetical protein